MINYNRDGGVEVILETGGNVTKSILLVDNVGDSNTGNYSCAAPNTQPASIIVYISEKGK